MWTGCDLTLLSFYEAAMQRSQTWQPALDD